MNIDMRYFEHLLSPHLFIGPFTNLRAMKWRAEQMLAKSERKPDEIDHAAMRLREAIDIYKSRREIDEFVRYIDRLWERGGWELRYLEDVDEELGPTREDIRHLLENWPEWADDKPDFITSDDFDDLESLQDLWLFPQPEFNEVLSFADNNEYLLFALLALMKLEEAAAILSIAGEHANSGSTDFAFTSSVRTHEAVWCGNLLVEAMEIVCYAERLLADSDAAKRVESEIKIKDEAEQARRQLEQKTESDKARTLANIRWAEDAEKRLDAKKLIRGYWDLWANDRSRYKNQGEFARDMEEKIEVEIGLTAKGKPLYSANTIEVKLIPTIRTT